MATYPLVIGGVSLIASIIGTYAVQPRRQRRAGALPGPDRVGVLAALAFLPITLVMMDDLSYKEGVSDLLRAGADRRRRSSCGSARWSAVAVTAGCS